MDISSLMQGTNDMTDRNFYEELDALRRTYPDLTFANKGKENIPADVRAANAEGQAKIEAILKETVADFIRFRNFRPRKDGTFAIRCQTRFSLGIAGGESHYFPLEKFKPDT